MAEAGLQHALLKALALFAGSGVTALHLAALKGSHTAVKELLRSGAAADAGTLSGVYSPQLSRGSTALHIAASRGHAGVVTALLDHQTGIPGVLPAATCHLCSCMALKHCSPLAYFSAHQPRRHIPLCIGKCLMSPNEHYLKLF